MSHIRITCVRPGLRRAGTTHPAVKVWPADAFSPTQIEQLEADPAFTVESCEAPTIIRIDPGAIRADFIESPSRPLSGRLFGVAVPESLLADIEELFAAEVGSLDVRPALLEIFGRHGWNTREGRPGTAHKASSAETCPAAPQQMEAASVRPDDAASIDPDATVADDRVPAATEDHESVASVLEDPDGNGEGAAIPAAAPSSPPRRGKVAPK